MTPRGRGCRGVFYTYSLQEPFGPLTSTLEYGNRKYDQCGDPRGWVEVAEVAEGAAARSGWLLVAAVGVNSAVVLLFSTFLLNVSLPHQW